MRRQILVLTLVTFVVVSCGAGAGSTPGGGGLSAEQILKRTAENYRGVKGYAISGSVATRMRIEGQEQNVANTLVAAYGGPGRTRFEADTPSERTLLVTSGDSTWTYISALGQYTVKPVTVRPAPMAGLPAIDPQAAHPFAGYARLAEHVAEAKLVGRDTATVDGRVVPTYEIEVTYDSTVAPAVEGGSGPLPKRLSIDAERFLVVGDQTTLERAHPALPKPIRIEQSARFTNVEWNVRPPDSLFTFRPPAGAARVEQLAQADGAATEEVSPLVGKPAPDFELADLQGAKRRLASHRGQVVLLDFWATWCGPCRREMPIIQRLHERFAKQGLVVYGVNCNEPAARAKGFMSKYEYRFPTLLDRNGEVQGSYQVTAIPTVFIVDRNGLIRAHLIGGRSESELLAALEDAGLDTGP